MTSKSDPVQRRWPSRSWIVAGLVLPCALELAARLFLPSLAWMDVLRPAGASYVARPSFEGTYEGVAPGAAVDVRFSTGAVGQRGRQDIASASWLALGSSTTFGLGVADDETWPAVVSRAARQPGCNLGLPGLDLSMAVAAAQRQCTLLKGKTVVVALQRDDLAKTPVEGWLQVREGVGKWSRAWAWWRLSRVPKGRELVRDPHAQLPVTELLSRLAELATRCEASVTVVQLAPLAPPLEQRGLRNFARGRGIRWLDVSEVMETLLKPDADTMVPGDHQLNAIGQRRLAERLMSLKVLASKRSPTAP